MNLVSPRLRTKAKGPGRRYLPRLEQLEDRRLLAIVIPRNDVNVSRANDNQAESTIAVDPTSNGKMQFAASVSFYGLAFGAFNPNVNIPNVGTWSTSGLFVGYSTTGGGPRTGPGGHGKI